GTLDRLDQTLRIDLLLAQYTRSLVVPGVLEGVLQHASNLAIGQAVGRLDLNACLDTGTQLARRNAEQTIGIDLEGHTNLRCPRHHRRNAAQLETRQRAAVGD